MPGLWLLSILLYERGLDSRDATHTILALLFALRWRTRQKSNSQRESSARIPVRNAFEVSLFLSLCPTYPSLSRILLSAVLASYEHREG